MEPRLNSHHKIPGYIVSDRWQSGRLWTPKDVPAWLAPATVWLSLSSFYGINLFLPFICSKFLNLAFVCVLSWLQVMPIVLHWCLFNSFQMLCYIYWLNVNVDICSSFYAKRRFYRSQCKTQANASWNSRLNKFSQCHRERGPVRISLKRRENRKPKRSTNQNTHIKNQRRKWPHCIIFTLGKTIIVLMSR